MALLVFDASTPPFNKTALPDLIVKAATSAVTLGLASYIIPITPIGTLILPTFIPLGCCRISSMLPIGSGRDDMFKTPLASASTPLAVRVNLSTIALDKFLLWFRSSLLALSIFDLDLRSSDEMDSNDWFLAKRLERIISRLAVLALDPTSVIYFCKLSNF